MTLKNTSIGTSTGLNVNTGIKMKKVFYEKRGSRYYPVSEYDSSLMDGLPKGSHLISVYPGGKSTRFTVEPNYAAVIAATRVAEDAISRAISNATEIRRQQRHEKGTPLTPGQKAAWEKLVEEFGEDARQLEWPSVRECAAAGAKAMQEEAEKLMKHESVRQAYEHFLMVCELTKEHNT
jgi:hypothetical protein